MISEVGSRRRLPLTRPEAVKARQRAREYLDAGWDRGDIVEALATTKAFTVDAVSFTVGQLREQATAAQKSRLTPFERAREGWR